MPFKASAPGSLMLLGEYGVLHGGTALVCAVDQRLQVTLIPRPDRTLELISELGTLQTTLPIHETTPPFQFVLAAIQHYQNYLNNGFTLHIDSSFSSQVGLASSAAVTVATVIVLSAWLKVDYSLESLIQHARRIVRSVQGLGSGADVAACVLGGTIAYRAKPLWIKKLHKIFPIVLVYSGHKTPTPVVVKKIETDFAVRPEEYQALLDKIKACADHGIHALQDHDLSTLGKYMNKQQDWMDQLGVNTPALENIIMELNTEPKILGAKISGSGLGDCVVALGTVSEKNPWRLGTQWIPVNITEEGARLEKI